MSRRAKNEEPKKPSKSRGRPKREDIPLPPDFDEDNYNSDKKGKSKRLNTYATVEYTSDTYQKKWDTDKPYTLGTRAMATDPLSNEWLDDIFINVISANAKKNNRNESLFYHIRTHIHETGNPLRLMFINIHTLSLGYYYNNIFKRYQSLTYFEARDEQKIEEKEDKVNDVSSDVNDNDDNINNSRVRPRSSVFTQPSELSNVPSGIGEAM